MAKAIVAALENLKEGRKYLSNRKNWIQGEFSEFDYDDEGEQIPDSGKFCAMGITEHLDGPGERRAQILLDQAARALFTGKMLDGFGEPLESFGVVEVNDDDTVSDNTAHKRVLQVFDYAIKLAKKAAKGKK